MTPKDSQGVDLAVGDTVTIQAQVIKINDDGTIAINVSKWSWISCSPAQVTKVTTP